VWWCAPVIPALRRLKQEDYEFEASLEADSVKKERRGKRERETPK
jgi:hypothetical protein